MQRTQVIIGGAGVVGLAIARLFALCGKEVIVLERENSIGSGISSRNSEVIHSGLYYPKGTLKTELCVTGRRMLYKFCDTRNINYNKCGKIIVATSKAQLPKLHQLETTGLQNGLTGSERLYRLTKEEVSKLEPLVHCEEGLMCPSTGVIDSHGLFKAYQNNIEQHGGTIVVNTPIIGGAEYKDKIEITTGGECPMTIACDLFVNACGLNSTHVSKSLGQDSRLIPKGYLAKGNYFKLTGCKQPFTHLIYPVPEQAGLGIHATIDTEGMTKFGPDVEWIDSVNYNVNMSRMPVFYEAVRKYFPSLPEGSLQPDFAGIRPKIQSPTDSFADFRIQKSPNAPSIHLHGIESPGLTASLAIAQYVGKMAGLSGMETE